MVQAFQLGRLEMSKLTNAGAPSSSTATRINLEEIVPDEIRFLFEPRPLLRGEDPHHYDLLVACTMAEVKPTDLLSWWSVKDIVDCIWESRRLRLSKTGVVK